MTADTLPLDDGCRLVPHVAPAPARRPLPRLVSQAPKRPPSHIHILFKADVPKGYDRLCDEAVFVPTTLEKLDLLETVDEDPPVAPRAHPSFNDMAGGPVPSDDATAASGGPLPLLPVQPGPEGFVGRQLPVLIPPVPEPSTWCALAAGLALLGLRRFRR